MIWFTGSPVHRFSGSGHPVHRFTGSPVLRL